MGAREKKPILAVLAAASILLGGESAADDAGESVFANELRILTAFTARLNTVTVDEETRLEVTRLEMAPGCAGFRLWYRTLPFDIWWAGTKVVRMPSGAGKLPRDRRESAGKLAALLFMVGSGAMPRNTGVTLTQHGTHVAYVVVPRDEPNPIERIQYEFDDVGLARSFVLERGGVLYRIELSERVSYEAVDSEIDEAPAARIVTT